MSPGKCRITNFLPVSKQGPKSLTGKIKKKVSKIVSTLVPNWGIAENLFLFLYPHLSSEIKAIPQGETEYGSGPKAEGVDRSVHQTKLG